MYLLDTNHCSHLIMGSPDIRQRLMDLGDARVVTCTIVRGELVFWAEKSERQEANRRIIEEFLADIDVLPVDGEAATFYGELKARIVNRFGPRERAKRRRATIERLGFTENDLWIAAIAQQHKL